MKRNEDPQMSATDRKSPQSLAEKGPRLLPSDEEMIRARAELPSEASIRDQGLTGFKALHPKLGKFGRYLVELADKPTYEELQLIKEISYEFAIAVHEDEDGTEHYYLTTGLKATHVEIYVS